MEKEKNAAELLKEELFMKKEHFSEAYSEDEVAKADEFCKGYMDFLQKGKTERECAEYIIEKAEKNGGDCYTRGLGDVTVTFNTNGTYSITQATDRWAEHKWSLT